MNRHGSPFGRAVLIVPEVWKSARL